MLMRYTGEIQLKSSKNETQKRNPAKEQAGVEELKSNSSSPAWAGLSVEELVGKIRLGDTAALGEVYDRYSGRVYAFLLRAVEREMAEELLQDVFMALWQKASMFDPERGSFNAWFFTLVRRRLYDALPRYQKHRSENSLSATDGEELAFEPVEGKHDLEEHVLRLFRDAEVRKALQHLPPDQRHTILMTYFGGLSQRELAEQLKVPVSTIKGRARLGLQRLRQLLPEQI
ncbi:MAG TPA: sigma-70 family RNA polymerase sigma factor [Chloroflexia bacterium]|nr:sigma-70 family RNA polymerase sigma factor [Chloroflexia bacterium]